MVLKLKTSSSLLPVHVIDVSVRPSSNKSVVPSPSTPNAGHTEVNRVRSYHDFRHQRQHHHTGIEIHHRSAGIEVGAADELFLVAPESRGVDGFADGLPQVVLRRGEQVEQRRRVVLRADELLDEWPGHLDSGSGKLPLRSPGDRRAFARTGSSGVTLLPRARTAFNVAVDGWPAGLRG